MHHVSRIVRITHIMSALGLALGLTAAVLAGSLQETKPEEPTAEAPRKDLPAAEEILTMAVEAMGGQKAFDTIESSYIKSTMAAMGFSIQFDMYTAEPDKLFVRQIIPGVGDGEMGVNGDVAWRRQPMQAYELLDVKDLVDLSDQAHLFEIVPKLREQYTTMQTVDRTEFAGQDCYKVLLAGKRNPKPEEADTKSYALFNAETHLAAGLQNVQPAKGDLPARTSTLRFEDWKPVDELKLKLYRKLIIAQREVELTMTYDEVTFNKVDPAVFAIPEEVQKLLAEKAAAPAPQAGDADPGVSRKTEEMLANLLKQEDVGQLRMIVGILESQLPNTPDEEKADMEYIIRKLKERIEELESGDGD